MLSKLAIGVPAQRHLIRTLQQNRTGLQNAVFKRNGGHNTIMVKPSPYGMRFFRNWFHFYALLIGIPLSVITTIINVRANPELIEVPEGYEPRHWEYYKHPVSRFVARYMYYPMEVEHEVRMAFAEYKSELNIIKRLAEKIDTVMRFYNDHRSRTFLPNLGADYIRSGREEWTGAIMEVAALPNYVYEEAYKETTAIPTEGYRDGPIDGM